MIKDALFVGSGGFVGSVARYVLGGLVFRACGAPRFPISTLVVNVVGCLIIGALSAAIERYHVVSPSVRLLLITGFLGGFTTFSAFGYETYFLAREHEVFYGVLNVALHVMCGLSAVWIGHRLITGVFAG